MASQVISTFRQTEAGVKLGRILFDPNLQTQISPSQITRLLRQAGIKVPVGVLVGADVAQVIMSGGSIVTSITEDLPVETLFAPSLNIVNAVTDIFELTGLLDPKSPAAKTIHIGTDAALVVSSGGANILADISLILDVVGLIGGKGFDELYAEAQNEATKKAYAEVNALRKMQYSAAARTFALYQTKQLSLFQMLSEVASESPMIFDNYFPQYKAFFPPQTRSMIASATAQGGGLAYGGSVEGWGFAYYQTIGNMSRDEIRTRFYNYFVIAPMLPYIFLQNQMNEGKVYYGKNYQEEIHLSILDIAALSMIKPYFNEFTSIDNVTDERVLQILSNHNMTPSELGYQIPWFDNSYQGVVYDKRMQGNRFESISEKASTLKNYDDSGNISALIQSREGKSQLLQWSKFPILPGNIAPQIQQNGELNSEDTRKLITDLGKNYRDIRNFWSAFMTADKLKDDPFFKDHIIHDRYYGDLIPGETPLGKLSDLEDRHRNLQLKITSKKLNNGAKRNIANFYGISVEKLKLSDPKTGGLIHAA